MVHIAPRHIRLERKDLCGLTRFHVVVVELNEEMAIKIPKINRRQY